MKRIRRWIISYLSFNLVVTCVATIILILSCIYDRGLYMILYMSNLILMCSANLLWLWINVMILKKNRPGLEITNQHYKWIVAHFASKKCLWEWVVYFLSLLLMYGTPGILAYLLSQQIHDSIFIPFLLLVILGYVMEKIVLFRIGYVYLHHYRGNHAH